jgi:hypothetical protein
VGDPRSRRARGELNGGVADRPAPRRRLGEERAEVVVAVISSGASSRRWGRVEDIVQVRRSDIRPRGLSAAAEPPGRLGVAAVEATDRSRALGGAHARLIRRRYDTDRPSEREERPAHTERGRETCFGLCSFSDPSPAREESPITRAASVAKGGR